MGIYTEAEKKEMHETAMDVLRRERLMASQLTLMNFIGELVKYLEHRPTLENLKSRLADNLADVVGDYAKTKAEKNEAEDQVLGIAGHIMKKEREAGDE